MQSSDANRRELAVTGLGLALGLLLTAALSRMVEHPPFGVTALDPITLVGVTLTVALVSVVASVLPAVRTMRVDPAVASRT